MLFLGFVLVVITVLIVLRIIYIKTKEFVTQNSKILKQITLLSNNYFFYSIEQHHIHKKRQKSLSAFRKINYSDELLHYVKSHRLYFEDQIKKATENAKKYEQYCAEFDYICKTQKSNWNSELKERIEKKLIENSRLSPVCSIEIEIENVYISPGGRSRHYEPCFCSQQDIIRTFSQIQDQESFNSKKHEERSKMNDSLRYDILKRDGFKCTICGATPQDGAKLHVDHIVPISKGGKTTRNNLRTLCSRCNLGKRDKYDPNGIN